MMDAAVNYCKLAADRCAQCVTDCVGQITPLGLLDRSLASARRMEFEKFRFVDFGTTCLICHSEERSDVGISCKMEEPF